MPRLTSLSEIEVRLASPRFSMRRKGMQQLLEMGRKDLLLAHALKERDRALVEDAFRALGPRPPPALVVHLVEVGRQPVPLRAIEMEIAHGNHLYAEPELHAYYAPKASRLSPEVVAALGRCYFRSFGPEFCKLAKLPMRNARKEFERIGKKALEGMSYSGWSRTPLGPDSIDFGGLYYPQNLERDWAASSWRAVAAVVALRHCDLPVDREDVERLLREAVQEGPHLAAGGSDAAWSDLQWVRFDMGLADLPDFSRRVWSYSISDYLTTLLKRRQFGLARELAVRFPTIPGHQFCYWPLLDFLVSEDLLPTTYSVLDASYRQARAEGIDPPPWWQWRT